MTLLYWCLVRPTRDDYPYPDDYDREAFMHALKVVNEPIAWRWPIAVGIRLWKRARQ